MGVSVSSLILGLLMGVTTITSLGANGEQSGIKLVMETGSRVNDKRVFGKSTRIEETSDR